MYRVGVIGCRNIGVRHAHGVEGLANAQLVAACDIVQQQLDEFAGQFIATNPELKLYTDYNRMLEEAKLDVVTVATGDNRHADPVVLAAETGARGIFCEKPLATTLEEADRMLAAVEEANALLSVDHTRRWVPVWHRCHELVASGAIGQVRRVVSDFGGGRAMLFRNGTHLFDAIRWFAGSQPEWLIAELEAGFEQYSEYGGDGGHAPTTEPSANAYIHFANGVSGLYLGEKRCLERSALSIVGSSGEILIEKVGERFAGRIVGEDGSESIEPPVWEVEGIEAGVQELVRALDGDAELSCSGRDGRAVVEMIIACLKSQQQGNAKIGLNSSDR